MMNKVWHLLTNEKLFFITLGIIYLIIFFILPHDLDGDQSRYVDQANSMTEGYYTNPDDPHVKNGPGFPLFLSFFQLLHAPLILPRLFNLGFMLGAVYFFYKTLSIYLEKKTSLLLSLVLGLHPLAIYRLAELLTETISLFLVSGFMYLFILALRSEKWDWKLMIGAGFFLGYLILTKVIFNYVTLACGLLFLGLALITRNTSLLKAPVIFFFSLIMCLPFLIYMYQLTGKVYSWGTNSGEILFYRATEYDDEVGNWYSTKFIINDDEDKDGYNIEPLQERYGEFLKSLEDMPRMQRDSILQKVAVEKLKSNPDLYAKNILASLSRMFFNMPMSFRYQRMVDLIYIIPNIILLIMLAVSILISLKFRKTFPSELWITLIFFLIFVGGMGLLNARGRYLVAVLPIFMLFPFATLFQYIKIELKNT